MNYNEAYNLLNKNTDASKLFSFILGSNNQSAIEYIKEITKCNDAIAKEIILNLENGLIAEKDDKPKKQYVQSNTPKCPTCSSTNIKKIGTGRTFFSKKINKSYKCKKLRTYTVGVN